MQEKDAPGPAITRAGDPRVTRVGRWLRAAKLDELPQLINVLRGEMALVGPRPDLPEIWSQCGESERQVLAVKPGVTGAASVAFRNESQVLAQAPPEQLMAFYLGVVLPQKTKLELDYATHASFWSDCAIMLRTLIPWFRSASMVVNRQSTYEQIPR